jgi:hypothetical protein
MSLLCQPAEPVAVITLRARAPRKKVVWTDDTVDNEHMNKKKSKCECTLGLTPRLYTGDVRPAFLLLP